MKLNEKQLEDYKKMQQSPLIFIEKVWGFRMQEVKPEFKEQLKEISLLTGSDWEVRKHEITADWFGDFDQETNTWYWVKFEKGKHITWQQWLILLSMEKAVKHEASKTITVASGRGIGKSATISMMMLWFLFSYPDCQIPCTAPGFQQMYDVLWKEIALWIHRMPPNIKALYEWESSHVRIKESPYTWFARAKTASKENPEALSGVHADYVLALADEGSGISDEIFEAAQGIFSSKDAFLVMISNPTRRNGYFFRSHHQAKSQWQCLQFSSAESPIVDPEIVARYGDDGIESDKYRVNILGLFPTEDAIDEKSYMQLIPEHALRMERPETIKFRDPVMGVDPSGEGDNETAYCVRDTIFMQIVGVDGDSTSKSIARSIMTLAEQYDVRQRNIVVDSFGVGADVAKEVALAVKWNIYSVNVVDKPDKENDKEMFVNKRAEMYWKMKEWIVKGGIVVENRKLREQLLSIRFRRTESGGKIQIMPKKEMRAAGIASPDLADAAAMTFLRTPGSIHLEQQQRQVLSETPFNKWGL